MSIDDPKCEGHLVYTNHIRFERNLFTQMGAMGLDFISGTHDDLIIGNAIMDIAGNGFSIGKFAAAGGSGTQGSGGSAGSESGKPTAFGGTPEGTTGAIGGSSAITGTTTGTTGSGGCSCGVGRGAPGISRLTFCLLVIALLFCTRAAHRE